MIVASRIGERLIFEARDPSPLYSLVNSWTDLNPSISAIRITECAPTPIFRAASCRTNTTLTFLQAITMFIDRIGIQQCCRASQEEKQITDQLGWIHLVVNSLMIRADWLDCDCMVNVLKNLRVI